MAEEIERPAPQPGAFYRPSETTPAELAKADSDSKKPKAAASTDDKPADSK